MKLYSVALSPFAARVRMAIYAKKLDQIEILPPPGSGTKSPEYLAIHPMGKIPALVTDDGTVIPESETIVEYLEDKFPATPLRPDSAEEKARARLVTRVTELYVGPAGGALFGQINPATRDQSVVDGSVAQLSEALTHLNYFLGGGPYAVGGALTTADCGLVPQLFFLSVFAQAFNRPELLTAHGKIGAYWAHVQTDPIAQRVLGEVGAALRERMAPQPAA